MILPVIIIIVIIITVININITSIVTSTRGQVTPA